MKKNASKILILAETGFIIRNLLLGKFPHALNPHIEITAAVQNPKDSYLLSKLGSRIRFINFPRLPEADVTQMSRVKRIFNLPHLMFRLVEGFTTNSSMAMQSKVLDSLSAPWYTLGVGALNFLGKALHTLGVFPMVENRLLGQVKKTKEYSDWKVILKKESPHLLISTMLSHTEPHRHSADLPVVLAAQNLDIKTGCIIQSWDNVTTKPSVLPGFIHVYWSWSEHMNKELLHYHPNLKREQLEIIGGLQFDYHNQSLVRKREDVVKEFGLNPYKPYILFTPGTRKLIPFEDKQCVKIIEHCLNQKLDVQYVIRLHPKDYGYRWKSYEKFIEENNIYLQKTAMDIPMDSGGTSSPADFYGSQINTIYHAAVLINTASTTAVDAALLDRPVINLGWDEQDDGFFEQGRAQTYLHTEHYKPIVESGGVEVALNTEECYEAILKYLKDPQWRAEGRKKIVETVTMWADGKAGERLAAEVQKQLGSNVA